MSNCNCQNCNKSCDSSCNKSCQNCTGEIFVTCFGDSCDSCDSCRPEGSQGGPTEDPSNPGDTGDTGSPNFTRAKSGLGIALTVTQWLDANLFNNTTMNRLRISGKRLKGDAVNQIGVGFSVEEVIANITPGNGPISLTTNLRNIPAGFWSISASLIDGREISSWSGQVTGPRTVVAMTKVHTNMGAARFTGTLRPGIIPIAWAFFVGLGSIIGLILQSLALLQKHLEIVPSLIISCVGMSFGFLIAKIWFVVQFKKPWRALLHSGVCIQGFLVGWSVAAVVSLLIADMSIGTYFDVSAPGIFAAMAIGRIGCFFGGCCAGVPTNSRWGVWSSDGRIGTRRIPTQLMESFTCMIIASAAFLLLNWVTLPGVVFIGSWIAYTVIRGAVLLPLRIENAKS